MKEAVRISGASSPGPGLRGPLVQVARGDQYASPQVYDMAGGPVLGLLRSVFRDPAQAQEVAREVLVEVWRTAPRFQSSRGSTMNWVSTLTHHRTVGRVRSAEASTERQQRAALI